MQLIPIAVDHVHVQEAEQSAGDQEAVWQRKVSDVARVQGKGVGWRGHGAQANQLADHIPDTNTWKSNKNATQQQERRAFSTGPVFKTQTSQSPNICV